MSPSFSKKMQDVGKLFLECHWKRKTSCYSETHLPISITLIRTIILECIPPPIFCFVFLLSLCLKKWWLYLFNYRHGTRLCGYMFVCVCECRCKCVFYTIFHNPGDVTGIKNFHYEVKETEAQEGISYFLPGPKPSRLWRWHSYSDWDKVKGVSPHQIKSRTRRPPPEPLKEFQIDMADSAPSRPVNLWWKWAKRMSCGRCRNG